MLRAGELLREQHALPVDHVDRDEPVRERRRRLDRLGQPLAQVGLQHEPVDDDLDRVLELLVEDDLLLEQPLLAVDLDPREAVGAQLLEHVTELALAVAHDGRVDGEARPLGQCEDLLDDLVEALPGDRAAADRAVWPSDAGVEEAKVVVDLGDGSDRRARVPRGRLLVDRDRRREPLDRVDVGLLHHLQELARVRGEALDVAALALGVDRVEGERRLAGAGEPGDADEGVPRQPDVDVLEVVLAGPVDDQLVGGHGARHSSERTHVRLPYNRLRTTRPGNSGRVSQTAKRAAVATLVVGGIVVLALALWELRLVVALLFLAFILAAAMRPAVDALARRGIPRAAGVGLHYVVLIGFVVAFVWAVVPRAIDQVDEALGGIPSTRSELGEQAREFDGAAGTTSSSASSAVSRSALGRRARRSRCRGHEDGLRDRARDLLRPRECGVLGVRARPGRGSRLLAAAAAAQEEGAGHVEPDRREARRVRARTGAADLPRGRDALDRVLGDRLAVLAPRRRVRGRSSRSCRSSGRWRRVRWRSGWG